MRKDNHWGARSKLVLRPTDTLKLTLAGDYFRTDDSTIVNIFPVAFNTATYITTGKLSDITSTGPISSQDSLAGYPSATHIRAWGVSAKGELDVGFADLTSITSYRRLKNHSDFDVDGAALDLFHLFYDSGSKTFQQELRLASRTTNPLSWQVGAFYLHGDAFQNQFQTGLAFRGVTSHIVSRGITNSISAFGEATYALTPTTHLTGGIRYTSDHRKLTGSYIETLSAATGALLPIPNNPKLNPLGAEPSATFNQVTFRGALRQDLTDDINVYVSVNKGFKAGEFNLQVPSDAPVKPETIMAYEGGLKGDFLDRHLRVSLSGFHYDISDYQIRTTVGTITALQNATKVKIDGVDINAEAALTSQFHVTAGASWLKARFGQFGGPGTNVIAPGVYPVADPGNATGHQTALAPHFTLNLGATYTVPLGDSRELRLTANLTHKSSYVFEADNVLRQPAYTVANASIEFKLNEHIAFEGYMRNIGDKNYNVQMVTAVGQAALAAQPRMYGLNFKYNY